jgi:hypothetical protein
MLNIYGFWKIKMWKTFFHLFVVAHGKISSRGFVSGEGGPDKIL